MTQEVRNHLYKVAVGIGGLLVLLGVANEGQVQYWLTVAAAVLNLLPLILAIRFSGKGVDVVPVDSTPVDGGDDHTQGRGPYWDPV